MGSFNLQNPTYGADQRMYHGNEKRWLTNQGLLLLAYLSRGLRYDQDDSENTLSSYTTITW